MKSLLLFIFPYLVLSFPLMAHGNPKPAEMKRCELEAFVTFGTAREAVKGKKKAYWKWQPETSDFQNSFIDDLYRRIDDEGFKDYMLFGAEKLVECIKSDPDTSVPDPAALKACFAEMDVVLHARQYKAGGGGLAGTKRFARNYLKDPSVYPQSMLDHVIPLAFAADDPETLFRLREELLWECALPRFPVR